MVQFFALGCRADDDAVSGLQRNQDLEDTGGGGVGGRDDAADDANGSCDALGAEGLVLFDHAAGLDVTHMVPDVLSCIVVLGDLINNDTSLGLFVSHLCQRDPHFVSAIAAASQILSTCS